MKLALYGLHRGSSADPDTLVRRARLAPEFKLWVSLGAKRSLATYLWLACVPFPSGAVGSTRFETIVMAAR